MLLKRGGSEPSDTQGSYFIRSFHCQNHVMNLLYLHYVIIPIISLCKVNVPLLNQIKRHVLPTSSLASFLTGLLIQTAAIGNWKEGIRRKITFCWLNLKSIKASQVVLVWRKNLVYPIHAWCTVLYTFGVGLGDIHSGRKTCCDLVFPSWEKDSHFRWKKHRHSVTSHSISKQA